MKVCVFAIQLFINSVEQKLAAVQQRVQQRALVR